MRSPTEVAPRHSQPVPDPPAPGKGRLLVLALLAVALVGGGMAVWQPWRGGDEPRRATPRDVSATAVPEGSATAAPAVPERATSAPAPSRSPTPTARPTPSRTTPPPRTRTVRSDFNDKCLDTADNVAVMAPCRSGATWQLAADGTVRRGNRCLEARDSDTDDGTDVLVNPCNRRVPGQVWRVNADRDLINANANKCLDIRDRDESDGAPLQLWTCVDGSNQKWTVSAS